MLMDLFARTAIFWRLRATRMAPWAALAFLGACAPGSAPGVGPDPVDPDAPASRMKAHSFLDSYVSRRPVEPSTRWSNAAPTTLRGSEQPR